MSIQRALPTVMATAIAVVMQLWQLLEADWGRLLISPYPVSDAWFYAHLAWVRAFLDTGGGFAAQLIPRSPYADLLTYVWRLLGPVGWAPYALNAALYAGAAGWTTAATQRLFGMRAAWCAALLTPLVGSWIFFAGLTVKTGLVTALTAWALYAAAQDLAAYSRNGHGHLGWALLAAAALGVAAIDRPPLALLSALWTAQWWWRTRRPIATVAIALTWITAIAPPEALGRNGPNPFAAPLGLNLYVGLAPGATGTYTELPELRDHLLGQALDGPRLVAKELGHPPTPTDVERYWLRRALETIAADPMRYARLGIRKLGMTLSREAPGAPEQYGIWRWVRPPLPWAVVDGALIWALALLGFWTLKWGRCSYSTHSPALPGATGLLLGWQLAYILPLLIFFVIERFRQPLWVLLLPPAAVGFAALVAPGRPWGQRTALYAAAALLYAASTALTALNPTKAGWHADPAAARAEETRRQRITIPLETLKLAAVRHQDPDRWTMLAIDLRKRELYPEAIAAARRAAALAPDRYLAYQAWYDAAHAGGDAAALEDLAAALEGVRPRALDLERFARLRKRAGASAPR